MLCWCRAARHEAEELRRQLLAAQAHARGLAAENAALRERLGLEPASLEPRDADPPPGAEVTSSPTGTPRADAGRAPAASGLCGPLREPASLAQGSGEAADAGKLAAGVLAGKPRSRLGSGSGRDGPGPSAPLPGAGAGGGRLLGALAEGPVGPGMNCSVGVGGGAGGRGGKSSEALLATGNEDAGKPGEAAEAAPNAAGANWQRQSGQG